MNIIIRQQRGGFVARFDADAKFAKPGKSRGEAIGNLVEKNKKRLGIKITWDMKDQWTKNYVTGHQQRNKKPTPSGIDTTKLPEVSGPEEAKSLKIWGIMGIPQNLKTSLLFLRPPNGDRHDITLGDICLMTEEELIQKSSLQSWRRTNIGNKRLAYIRIVLQHYGLTFKASV